jgi:hypothetical protein
MLVSVLRFVLSEEESKRKSSLISSLFDHLLKDESLSLLFFSPYVSGVRTPGRSDVPPVPCPASRPSSFSLPFSLRLACYRITKTSSTEVLRRNIRGIPTLIN